MSKMISSRVGARGQRVRTLKSVPASPDWMNKFIASAVFGPVSGQLIGDYIGKRYATYTNDMSVPSCFLLSAQASYALPNDIGFLHDAKISLNVSNLLQRKGIYEVVVGAASGTYNSYPISAAPVLHDLVGEAINVLGTRKCLLRSLVCAITTFYVVREA
jgi:hypothetical protein